MKIPSEIISQESSIIHVKSVQPFRLKDFPVLFLSKENSKKLGIQIEDRQLPGSSLKSDIIIYSPAFWWVLPGVCSCHSSCDRDRRRYINNDPFRPSAKEALKWRHSSHILDPRRNNHPLTDLKKGVDIVDMFEIFPLWFNDSINIKSAVTKKG